MFGAPLPRFVAARPRKRNAYADPLEMFVVLPGLRCAPLELPPQDQPNKDSPTYRTHTHRQRGKIEKSKSTQNYKNLI